MEVPWDEEADGPMPEWMRPKAWYLPEMGSIESPDGDFYLPFNKGGFCPIELDVLLHERYRVIAFAGNGSFAMVWVAVDEKHRPGDSSPKYVAIKVSRGVDSAEEAQHSNEEASLRRLMQGRADDAPGSRHIIRLLDAFNVESPNGIHRCLVLEQAGSALSALDGVAQFNDMINIFRQCATAVEYMHSMGVVHGDLDVSNIVASVPDCSGLALDDFYSRFGDPSYDHPKKRFFDEEHQSVGDIRLIDFGESFMGAKRGVNTHSHNTPPEIIEDEEATCKSDIWSLGCILWHLWFGCHLMGNYVGIVDPDKNDQYGHQRSFLNCTRSERKENLVAYVDDLYGDDSAKKPAFDALLELILNCTEPSPDDRPTAQEIVSSRIWEEKVLSVTSQTSEDSTDEHTGAEEPFKGAELASRQTMAETDPRERSQNEGTNGDTAALGPAITHSNSPEAPKISSKPVGDAPTAVADVTNVQENAQENDGSSTNSQKKWRLWWPLSIVQDWFWALWNWRT
ncbi:uncharacterized protein PpBr36_09516 [Pyricularia pennisetigena]|uniref:uncharacterized protein n=1 Tax=Pyricularia pennisetigena TaxID=1578925 RepID=UPI0011518B53|nr:uncharacterized protein PpBr36_09516 [Pyricularia pennisetigena]TLS22085.1 hypothetical protein PpBr36_09516 [Pyricularia pennisetigena]